MVEDTFPHRNPITSFCYSSKKCSYTHRKTITQNQKHPNQTKTTTKRTITTKSILSSQIIKITVINKSLSSLRFELVSVFVLEVSLESPESPEIGLHTQNKTTVRSSPSPVSHSTEVKICMIHIFI